MPSEIHIAPTNLGCSNLNIYDPDVLVSGDEQITYTGVELVVPGFGSSGESFGRYLYYSLPELGPGCTLLRAEIVVSGTLYGHDCGTGPTPPWESRMTVVQAFWWVDEVGYITGAHTLFSKSYLPISDPYDIDEAYSGTVVAVQDSSRNVISAKMGGSLRVAVLLDIDGGAVSGVGVAPGHVCFDNGGCFNEATLILYTDGEDCLPGDTAPKTVDVMVQDTFPPAELTAIAWFTKPSAGLKQLVVAVNREMQKHIGSGAGSNGGWETTFLFDVEEDSELGLVFLESGRLVIRYQVDGEAVYIYNDRFGAGPRENWSDPQPVTPDVAEMLSSGRSVDQGWSYRTA